MQIDLMHAGHTRQDVIETFTLHRHANYVNLAAFVIILYEHLSTIDREVSLVWSRKLSRAKITLLLNRYMSLLMLFLSLGPMLLAESHLTWKQVIPRGQRSLSWADIQTVL
ncbi:hypothetical protein OH77DRAFT_1416426 [Trametes cingulata]|nr:hypothetical protein OH77DRAFT_1416426 [Trametes cingulata]